MWVKEDNWWSDQIWDYTLTALTDEVIEMKHARADNRKLALKHDCEIIYNQYTEQRE